MLNGPKRKRLRCEWLFFLFRSFPPFPSRFLPVNLRMWVYSCSKHFVWNAATLILYCHSACQCTHEQPLRVATDKDLPAERETYPLSSCMSHYSKKRPMVVRRHSTKLRRGQFKDRLAGLHGLSRVGQCRITSWVGEVKCLLVWYGNCARVLMLEHCN